MPRVNTELCALLLAGLFVVGSVSQLAAQPEPADESGDAVLIDASELSSPLLVEPSTPEEVFDAVLLMHKLARPRLAKRYLEQLMQTSPDNDLLLRLRDQHGPAVFLILANTKSLQPLSTQLLDGINQAIREHGTDPTRIDALIADLSGTPKQREVARLALQSAGPYVVPRLLMQLESGTDENKNDLIVQTLTLMGSDAVPPLLGALESPLETVRATAIEVLGFIGPPEVAGALWYSAASEKETPGVRVAARFALARLLKIPVQKFNKITPYGAAARLQQLSSYFYQNRHQWQLDEDGLVSIWTWLPATEKVGMTRVPPRMASLYRGQRLAREALALDPNDIRVQALFLSLALSTEANRSPDSWPPPSGPQTAHDLALTSGADVVLKSLELALEAQDGAGATATLNVLSQIASQQELSPELGHDSPIVAALNSRDGRVQFAAATTILQLNPSRPFRGISRVVEILTRALNDSRSPNCLVVGVNAPRATTLAGFVTELGFEPLVAKTGRSGFRVATERMDVELILLDINTIRWGVTQTVSNLRADARTKDIPIAIYGPASMRPRAANLLTRFPQTTYLVESTTAENISVQLKPFLKDVMLVRITPEQRAQQTAAAVEWFAHIASNRDSSLFDISTAEEALVEASGDPALADNALIALAGMPGSFAQEHLKVVALSPHKPLDIREEATLHLAYHIQRFGLLLSRQDVADIKREWKAAKEPALATALAAIVGSLKPSARRVSDRMQVFPTPALPPSE